LSRSPVTSISWPNPRGYSKVKNAVFTQLRGDQNDPLQRTTRKWSTREQTEGHYRAYAMNGNIPSGVLVGDMQFYLVMYRILFPKATAAEVNCYLFNTTSPGHEQRLYSGYQICGAEDDAGLIKSSSETIKSSRCRNYGKRLRF
jgi:hypothetical protein